jgi:hypothetical protein
MVSNDQDFKEDRMQRKSRALWMAAAIVGMLDLMVPTSYGQASHQPTSAIQPASSLKPPASGKINVAFVISEGADVMDIAGPWETLHGAMLTSKGKPWNESDWDDMVMPINVYTVSDSLKPVDANGLTIVPNYTFENAPKPQVIVIPAQNGRSAAQKAWLLANSATAKLRRRIITFFSDCRSNIPLCTSSAEPAMWRMAKSQLRAA